jgi:hypothetical protein
MTIVVVVSSIAGAVIAFLELLAQDFGGRIMRAPKRTYARG